MTDHFQIVIPNRQISVLISQKDLVVLFVEINSRAKSLCVDGFERSDKVGRLSFEEGQVGLVLDQETVRVFG